MDIFAIPAVHFSILYRLIEGLCVLLVDSWSALRGVKGADFFIFIFLYNFLLAPTQPPLGYSYETRFSSLPRDVDE